MTRRLLGRLIFFGGVAYLIGVAWLKSWWYVPDYLSAARSSFLEPGVFGGSSGSLVWALSGLIGPLLVAFGLLLYSGLGRVGLLAALGFLLAFGTVLYLPGYPFLPPLFGIGGGLILAAFLTATWFTIRPVRALEGPGRTVAVMRLLAYTAFFIAAWGLCGALGVPFLSLRGQLAQELQTQSMAQSMAVKVMVSLVVGWLLVAASHWLEARSRPASS